MTGDRAAALTALLATAPDNRDHDAVRAFMRDAADLGLALLLVYPDAKVPADMRTPHQRRDDDNAARRAAKQAGNPTWRKVRSASGVTLATTDTAALDAHLDAYLDTFGDDHPDGVPVNLAVAVGPSRLVVVDADTPGQVARFNANAGTDAAPTVSTPGQVDPATGEWVHSDGRHWWFAVPETVELLDNAHAITLGADDADGYAALFGARRYVLIPPSTRPEGTYKATGSVEPLPDWLRDAIDDHGRRRAERAAHSLGHIDADDPIRAWGAGTSWAEILGGTEWMETGKADSCGCPIWTAPGAHASPKSATGHEVGCAQYPDSPDPILHIWTTGEAAPFDQYRNGAGEFNVTRFDAVAAIHYDGSRSAAMAALNDANDALALDDDLDADAGRDGLDDTGQDGPVDAAGPHLPDGFWERRPSLRHIRDAALKNRATPDATLAAALARIASRVPPGVTVDTGIMSPVSLNFYATAVSWSGQGKTSAMRASDRVLTLRPSWSTDPMDSDDSPVMVPADEPFPRVGKIRSGEGIAEMYWGDTTVIGPNNRPTKVRRRIRSNVLMHTDEGASLVAYILDPKQTVGETLREGWSGEPIGQSNSDGTKYRFVDAGVYRLALVVGFHLSTVADLLTEGQILLGTPQRFYLAWSKPDPKQVSREMLKALADPGPLTVTIPSQRMRLCASLRDRVDEDRIADWLRDDDADGATPDLESQRVAMVARLAGLLAILDGRTETDELGLLVVTEEDWELAETMFSTSVAIANLAIADRRKRQARTKRAERARSLAESIEDDEARSTPVGRAKARIVGYLTDGGKARWSGKGGIRFRFNGEGRKDADAALAELTSPGEGRVRLTDGPRGVKYVELVG